MTTREPEVALRQADRGDEWAVHRLFQALHQYNRELDPMFSLSDEWEKVLNDHLVYVRVTNQGLILLAWREDKPVGLLMMDGHSDSPLFRYRHWAELVALYVDPSERGDDLADRLLQEGIEWAQKMGYERVQLYVTASNTRAKRFYERNDFEPVQEIWRLQLPSSDRCPPEDALCNEAHEHGHHLLSVHPHLLVAEENDENRINEQ